MAIVNSIFENERSIRFFEREVRRRQNIRQKRQEKINLCELWLVVFTAHFDSSTTSFFDFPFRLFIHIYSFTF